jgi:hypothetical protein
MPRGYRKDGTKLGFQVGHKSYDGFKGKHFSEESRRKIALTKIGSLNPAKRQSVRKKLSRNHADVTGSNNPRWKGGQREEHGYIAKYCPDHPNCVHGRYVREHRLIMEGKLGRYLERGEVVHHKNGNKKDNRPENLELLPSESEHRKVHWDLMKRLNK